MEFSEIQIKTLNSTILALNHENQLLKSEKSNVEKIKLDLQKKDLEINRLNTLISNCESDCSIVSI